MTCQGRKAGTIVERRGTHLWMGKRRSTPTEVQNALENIVPLTLSKYLEKANRSHLA